MNLSTDNLPPGVSGSVLMAAPRESMMAMAERLSIASTSVASRPASPCRSPQAQLPRKADPSPPSPTKFVGAGFGMTPILRAAAESGIQLQLTHRKIAQFTRNEAVR